MSAVEAELRRRRAYWAARGIELRDFTPALTLAEAQAELDRRRLLLTDGFDALARRMLDAAPTVEPEGGG